MGTPTLDRKLLAILAADMVGYSKAMEADEAGTIKRLKAIRAELINPAISQRHGTVIKLMGDGTLVAFDSVVDAVACAAEFQNVVAARNADLPEPERIVFRVGINLGDVALVDGDVYGDGVNVAARLEHLAEPGGVVVSNSAAAQKRDVYDYGNLALVREDLVREVTRSTVQNAWKAISIETWLRMFADEEHFARAISDESVKPEAVFSPASP